MDGVVVAFFVPTVVFLVIVAPLWIILHYRSRARTQSQLSADERESLETLATRAEKMAERIETLEAILDEQTPDWRDRLRASEYTRTRS